MVAPDGEAAQTSPSLVEREQASEYPGCPVLLSQLFDVTLQLLSKFPVVLAVEQCA